MKVSFRRFYNRQEEVLYQKSPKVIDRFVFNYLAVDNAGQTSDNKHTGSIIFAATAHAQVATTFRLIESILRGLSETFGSRSIFLAHDNSGSKFDKHPISIDFTGYKKTNKLID